MAPRREVCKSTQPGAEGDFGVRQGHEPFMTTLRPGEVIVRDGGSSRIFTVDKLKTRLTWKWTV